MSRISGTALRGRGGYLGLPKFAALEAERLTSTAEPDALYLAVPMSGGAEPAGAAKPSPEGRP